MNRQTPPERVIHSTSGFWLAPLELHEAWLLAPRKIAGDAHEFVTRRYRDLVNRVVLTFPSCASRIGGKRSVE